MTKTLVRFSRSYGDDEEIVARDALPALPTPEAYFSQLVRELTEVDTDFRLEMVKFEREPNVHLGDKDSYVIYATVDDAPPMAALVPRLQACYDNGAAGFFEVIMEGIA